MPAQIGLAIQNYHAEHGTFPPISVRDAEGKPLHSWRVLLLPYFGLEDIYRRYDFSEPWNGPKNTALANDVSERVAHLFRCPNDECKQKQWATFLALITKGSDGSECMVVTDGSERGLSPVILELHSSTVHWMEPRDCPAELMDAGLIRNNPESGIVNFLSMDGQVWSLTENQLILNGSESGLIRCLTRPD